MKPVRAAFVALGVICLALACGHRVRASFVQTQQDQIGVYILVHVTPAPVAYRKAGSGEEQIALRMGLRARGSARFVDDVAPLLSNTVAQSQTDVRVQAEVSPNPKATLLYYNIPVVDISQTAGTTQTTPACVYTITVDTPSTTSWTLDDGLSNDFVNGWSGTTLRNNTYLQGAAPQPTSTPFVVYPDNANKWNTKVKSNGMHTYCVTLTLSIPAGMPGGAYGTTAVYTLYY